MLSADAETADHLPKLLTVGEILVFIDDSAEL
jgi:hypothetical protein